MNTRFLSLLSLEYENEVRMLRVNVARGGITMHQNQEVIGDRYTRLKRSGKVKVVVAAELYSLAGRQQWCS